MHNVSTPCFDDRQFKIEELETVGKLAEVCSQIAFQCLYLARISRPDIVWTVNWLVRHVTKWNRARGKRLARLTCYTHHSGNYRQYCHVGDKASGCKFGLLEDANVAGDLEDCKSTSRRVLCIFGSQTFWSCFMVQETNSCSAKAAPKPKLSHFDASLRLDGSP